MSVVKSIPIPLPPLATQKKIAAILDAADAYRQKTKALIGKYEQLGQSLFLEMFGDPVVNPKGWDVRKLGDVSKVITKGESPKWQGYAYTDKGIRFITSENVRLGYLDNSKDKFVPLKFHEKLIRSQLKEDDLLINLVGASIGRGALVKSNALPANINQAVSKIELNLELIDPIFLLQQIITPQIQGLLIGNKVEGARANISLKNVRELKIIYPPLLVQKEYIRKFKLVQVQKAKAEESLGKAEALFGVLLQRAFKGELV
jgi:type I restriction enzyme S subunit